jgi:hypothetical protein
MSKRILVIEDQEDNRQILHIRTQQIALINRVRY